MRGKLHGCSITFFHCSCLGITQYLPKTWYCPTCRTLPRCKRGKGSVKGNKPNCAALCLQERKPHQLIAFWSAMGQTVPMGSSSACNAWTTSVDPIILMLNNSVNWKCDRCKIGTEVKTTMRLSSSGKPICLVQNHQSTMATPQTNSAAPKLQWGTIWISFDPKFFKAAGRSSLDKIWRRCFDNRVNILLKYVIVL